MPKQQAFQPTGAASLSSWLGVLCRFESRLLSSLLSAPRILTIPAFLPSFALFPVPDTAICRLAAPILGLIPGFMFSKFSSQHLSLQCLCLLSNPPSTLNSHRPGCTRLIHFTHIRMQNRYAAFSHRILLASFGTRLTRNRELINGDWRTGYLPVRLCTPMRREAGSLRLDSFGGVPERNHPPVSWLFLVCVFGMRALL